MENQANILKRNKCPICGGDIVAEIWYPYSETYSVDEDGFYIGKPIKTEVHYDLVDEFGETPFYYCKKCDKVFGYPWDSDFIKQFD